MTEAIDHLAAVLTPSDSTVVSLGAAGAAAFQEGYFLLGRLLAPKAKLPGFKGTIPTIWHIRSGLTIQDTGELFVFQFESASMRTRIMHGGPWFYRNTMLVVGEYDGLGPVESVPLNLMEAWVFVKGLPIALRNKVALSMVGSSIGHVVRFDLNALKSKEEEQRIKIVFYVRRRIRTWMIFEFSSVVKLELVLIYEKVKGFCPECGLFLHDALGCDKTLVKEKEAIKAKPLAAAMAGLSLSSEA
ncbi:uncharacterized protein LOC112203582 [Rosa chinensis]|uniref:uncharacterized protein LOC112203582 n=1 Tax=Rosa chinensis TaxID=74649 RepID=UPI000D0949C1|nr:uncharacterized protein LOC112203582 [Rosa chinensis]